MTFNHINRQLSYKIKNFKDFTFTFQNAVKVKFLYCLYNIFI